MDTNHGLEPLHPKGDLLSGSNSLKKEALTIQSNQIVCNTFKGVVHLEWDSHSPVTPLGQLFYLAGGSFSPKMSSKNAQSRA